MTDIFGFILVPLGYVMRFAYSITNNYMLAILLFSLLMELLMIPLAIKQQKNQIKQAMLAPKVAAISKKYAGRTDQATKQRQQQEVMAMYQEEHFNPMGGCLPIVIQLPIIMILYGIIRKPLTYISMMASDQITAISQYFGQSAVDEIGLLGKIRDNISELSVRYPSLREAIIPQTKVGPFDLSLTPQISFDPFNWLMLIPVLTFVIMIVTQKIMQRYNYQSPEAAETQNRLSMKIMMYTMPLLSVFIEFQMPAAIGVYWIFRSILQTVEKIIIAKIFPLPKFTEEDYKKAEKEAGKEIKQKSSGQFVRSLHHIDDEEYIERHKDELKELEEARVEAEKKPTLLKKLAAGKEAEKANEKTGGKVTTSSEAPAAIKNDEKTQYVNKKKKKK